MSCEQFREEMSPYIDGMLEGDEKIRFEDHLNSCVTCKEEFEQFKAIIDEVHILPEEQLPEHYHEELLLKLYQKKEEKKLQKKAFYQNWKMMSTFAAGFLILIFVIGNMDNIRLDKNESTTDQAAPMAASEMYDMAVAEESQIESEEIDDGMTLKSEVKEDSASSTEFNNSRNIEKSKASGVIDRKIIYSTFMSLEVEVFDNSINKIKDIARQSGGYVENSSSYIYHSEPERDIYLKQGNITIRIPVEKYGQIQEQISTMGHLIHQEETSINVTEEYIETESRVRMLEVEQERLLEIMKKAEKVDDLIKLEQRLNQVRTDLEIYKSKIKNWDQLVAFSTFSIELREVKEIEEIKSADPNLQTKLKSNFIRSINDLREEVERMVVALAYGIVPFILFMIVLGISFLIFKPLFKKLLQKIRNWKENLK